MFTWGMTHRRVRSNDLPLAKLKSQILKKNTFFIIFQCAKKKWEFREYKHSQNKSFGGIKGYELHGWFRVQSQSELLLWSRCRSDALRLEDVHGPHDVLPADRTLVHPLAALGAGDHVTALQENAVNHSVHADPAEVVVVDRQWTLLAVCKTKTQRGDWKWFFFVFCFLKQQKTEWYCIPCTVEGQDDSTSSYPSYLGKVMLTIFSKMSMPVTVECQDVSMTTTQSLSLEACW